MARPISERKPFCIEKDGERGTFYILKEVLYLTTVYEVWAMNKIRVWGVAGMKLTGANRSTWRKICPSATSSTTNPTTDRRGVEIGYSV